MGRVNALQTEQYFLFYKPLNPFSSQYVLTSQLIKHVFVFLIAKYVFLNFNVACQWQIYVIVSDIT